MVGQIVFNPSLSKNSPLDESNHLTLAIVKYSGVNTKVGCEPERVKNPSAHEKLG